MVLLIAYVTFVVLFGFGALRTEGTLTDCRAALGKALGACGSHEAA